MVLLEHLSHCKPVYHRYEKRKQAARNSKTKRGCVQAERGQELTCHYCTVWFKGSGSEFAVLIPVQYSVVSWEFWAKEVVRVMMCPYNHAHQFPGFLVRTRESGSVNHGLSMVPPVFVVSTVAHKRSTIG
ncbi:putative endo-beta-1,4-glucanase D [Fusarium oxysporum f. sp. albedinis]|nr:putative endo-beta-1,4-glucanase D [Fusarium oxysporum f. sp. albedinis]